jgi:hypothetical protein
MMFSLSSCKSSGESGGLFGIGDETREAKKLVEEANEELNKIKILYHENEGDDEKEGKRKQLLKALNENDPERVKKISDDIVKLISDGTDFANAAIEKLQQAQGLNTGAEYKEYLRYKELALTKQVEAFDEYRQAAKALRDNYDPNNEQLREKVKVEFEQRQDKHQELMEKARDLSSLANEHAKDALRREAQQ